MLDLIEALDPKTIRKTIDSYRRMPESSRAADRRMLAPLDLEGAAVFASAALSALLTGEDPATPFRFKVTLRPDLHRDGLGDFICDVEEDAVHLQITQVPKRMMEMPEAFHPLLLLHLACDGYVETIRRINPDHKWHIREPARQMTIDALQMSAAEIEAAKRSIWN